MKQTTEIRIRDTHKLQEIIHYHGLEEFLQLLRIAYFDASDDMEDIDKEISEKYRSMANSIEVTE